MTQINRSEIEECIFRYVKDVFKYGDPSYSETEIREAIKIFYNFSNCKLGYEEIDGFSKIILKPLQILSKDSSDLSVLRILSTSLEPFLKRLIILLQLKSYNEIRWESLIFLLKTIDINKDITARKNDKQYPVLDIDHFESYRGSKEYLEYICLFYMTRNDDAHRANNLSAREMVNRFEAILVVYIYAVLYYLNDIKPYVEALLLKLDGSILDTQENKWLYDLMSYGTSATELKTQIVDAFILNTVFDGNIIKRTQLDIEFKKQFGQTIADSFINRRIKRLVSDRRINDNSDEISLTDNEVSRINNVRENFKDNKNLFILYLEDILDKYNIKQHKNDLIEKLKVLFTENFNLDLAEIYDHGEDGVNTQYQVITNFIDNNLMEKVGDKEIANKLMKDLLDLCVESDFLLCISASSVFNNISNVDKYQNFINQPIKKIYLDTQIILYALCIDFRRNDQIENPLYRISKELCRESLKYDELKLILSSHYIREVSKQLKNALSLIVYESILNDNNFNLSNNVFYQIYAELKRNSTLEEDYIFSDFMEECFNLYEDDIYDESFFSICESIVRDKINELGYVKVEEIPIYNNLNEIEKLIELTIEDKKLPPKTHMILKNDAVMLSHLASEDQHSNSPFFLTWDKSFLEFRKAHNSKYLRRSTHRWHIFSPSKFINHIALMHMHIDPKSITDDFLSVINSFGLTQKAKTIYDTHNKFLNIKNITKEKRYKYISILKDIFNDKEFSYDSDIQTPSAASVNYDGILDALNQHYYNNKELSITLFRLMLLEEEYFIQVASLIKAELLNKKNESASNQSFESLFKSVDLLVKKFIEEKKPITEESKF